MTRARGAAGAAHRHPRPMKVAKRDNVGERLGSNVFFPLQGGGDGEAEEVSADVWD